MKDYIRERKNQEIRGRIGGIALAVAVHVAAATGLSFSSVRYIWPPLEQQPFVLDFEQEVEPPKPLTRGNQPRSEEVDRTKPVELAQKSESVYASAKQNLTPATKPDTFGDVETPAPEQEAKLDPRAAFPGMAKKDTSITAPHSATEASATFKAGQVDGNTKTGDTEGRPNAHLKGRSTVGNLPRPSYNSQESGIVVVNIWVDNYGKVQKAVAGGDGTTVTDRNLWNAARKSAMETHFNVSADAPAMQEGTITYIFKLK